MILVDVPGPRPSIRKYYRSGITQIDNEVRMFGADLSPSANFTFQSAQFNQPCCIILGRILKNRPAAWLVVGLFLHPKGHTPIMFVLPVEGLPQQAQSLQRSRPGPVWRQVLKTVANWCCYVDPDGHTIQIHPADASQIRRFLHPRAPAGLRLRRWFPEYRSVNSIPDHP